MTEILVHPRAKKLAVKFSMVAAKFLFLFMVCFLSVNVNGLRDPGKRLFFCHWLSSRGADVICLQELHCTSVAEVKSWFPSFSVVASSGSNRSCGVAVLFKSNFSFVDSYSDVSGRFVRARLLFGGCTFNVVALYAPNSRSDRVTFFQSLTPLLDTGVPTLLCGDFNSVIDPFVDRRSAAPTSSDSPSELLSLFAYVSCVDVWRSCNPFWSIFFVV